MSLVSLTPSPANDQRRMRFSYPDGSKPLDGFTIERGIGAGGFGEVYCAVNDAGKRVALKKIQRNLDVELRGVRQCINLRHVNLISLWDIRTNDHGESWVVMEYVPGPSLRDILGQHPTGLPDEEVKRWFLSTASGVAYLHHQGIVHRDLKPGNIFLDDETQVIKIGDYGLSKFMSASRRSGQTESVGTFHYMAPEIGRGVYGKEIDIYALGIILFEIITGDVPFDGESTQEIIMKHLTDNPRLDHVPVEFRKCIERALLKDPLLRYHSVPEMLLDVPWPEVVENCQQIISRHSVGPIMISSKEPTDSQKAAYKSTHDHIQNQIIADRTATAPITHAESSSAVVKGRVHEDQLPPTIIISGNEVEIVNQLPIDCDIIFGPVVELPPADDFNFFNPSDGHPSRTATAGSFGGEGSVRQSESYRHSSSLHSAPANGSQTEVTPSLTGHSIPATELPVKYLQEKVTSGVVAGSFPNLIRRRSDEPIARAIQTGFYQIGHWWNYGNVSTPLKLLLLVVASIVIIKNSDWLLPLTIGLGLIYLVYCGIRSWWNAESIEKKKKLIRREQQKLVMAQIRHQLHLRQVNERAIELLGSLLLSAFACIVFNLLGLSLGGKWLQSTTTAWAIYAWMTTTTIFACWGLLLISKFWEDRPEDNLLRRVTMLILGILTGVFSFSVANIFSINLADTGYFSYGPSIETPLTVKGMPLLPAYLIFFSGLFVILRWWLMADPVRKTRLSILSVSLCLIWACLFSCLLELPVIANSVMAVVISVSVQLSAPWISLQHFTTLAPASSSGRTKSLNH